tara:strand:+ start:66 stop:443 length:378 start_codon:yes stop_codon:yes gene_type:complete
MEKIPSNRSFGIVFFVFFLIICLWPLLNDNQIRIWSLIVAIIFLILGLLNSKFLTPLNRSWLKLGELLGRVVSPLVMGLIYFVILTPIGLFMRLIQKDLLRKKFSKANSYWIKRDKNIGTMKRQF